jgi:hypothetical protein
MRLERGAFVRHTFSPKLLTAGREDSDMIG